MAIRISPMIDQDCKEVAAFLAHALPEIWRMGGNPDADQIQRVVSSVSSIGLVARQEGAVVGLAIGWCFSNAVAQGDAVMLDELLVDPAMRGNGIGTALVDAFKKTAQHQARTLVEVWATTDFPTEPAATPFAKTGGKKVGLLRQFDWPQEAFT